MRRSNNAFFALALCVLTIGYGLFQARILIYGPTLLIFSPKPGETVTDSMVLVKGTTKNVTHIFINGQPITMDISGSFSQSLVTPHGYGIILVEATNRFGRRTTQEVEIVGAPQQTDNT